jgi:hypothetical protein
MLSLNYLFSFKILTVRKGGKNSSNTIDNEYNIEDWPVSLSNKIHLHAIKDNYDVQQLPTYDIKNNPIHPSDYEEKLAGSIARVCFSIVHYVIKQKHVFNALVKDITVICPPTSIAPTSLKHILHSPKKRKFN